VFVVSPDSLEFVRDLVRASANKPPVRNAEREALRLATADVLSVEVLEQHDGRSMLLIFVGIPAALFAIAFLNLLVNGYD
jgi:hypothetical protein